MSESTSSSYQGHTLFSILDTLRTPVVTAANAITVALDIVHVVNDGRVVMAGTHVSEFEQFSSDLRTAK